MKFGNTIVQAVSLWLDAVAAIITRLTERFVSARPILLVEENPGLLSVRQATRGNSQPPSAQFLRIGDGAVVEAVPPNVTDLLKGKHAELLLQPTKFLFRPLDLPKRAADFLDGIVRAQIDRLTPWTAREAAFGWTQPSDLKNDRIAITVAATSLATVNPYLQALAAAGANSVTITTRPPDANPSTPPVKVLERRDRSTLAVARIRQFLAVILIVSAVCAAVTTAAAFVVGDRFEAELADIVRQIGERRNALRARREATGSNTPQRALEIHKHEVPASVVVLEALSQILPDHTYVSELRIEGQKLQLIGVSQDAPSLIRLIEQSPLFTRATFFAPTTRSTSDPGERFHIEAHIKPNAVPRT